tara:strand:+ start:137 stop:400 length:264 start_codon:yes stop_codon:yes gene_type:complete
MFSKAGTKKNHDFHRYFCKHFAKKSKKENADEKHSHSLKVLRFFLRIFPCPIQLQKVLWFGGGRAGPDLQKQFWETIKKCSLLFYDF